MLDQYDQGLAAQLRLDTVVPALGGLAQLVERVLCKHEVSGSSPLSSSRAPLLVSSRQLCEL